MTQQAYFSPHAALRGDEARARGCLTCRYNEGARSASHVVCERFEKPRVVGDAKIGCAYWEREPGADDC
jgi:hypothetical protein